MSFPVFKKNKHDLRVLIFCLLLCNSIIFSKSLSPLGTREGLFQGSTTSGDKYYVCNNRIPVEFKVEGPALLKCLFTKKFESQAPGEDKVIVYMDGPVLDKYELALDSLSKCSFVSKDFMLARPDTKFVYIPEDTHVVSLSYQASKNCYLRAERVNFISKSLSPSKYSSQKDISLKEGKDKWYRAREQSPVILDVSGTTFLRIYSAIMMNSDSLDSAKYSFKACYGGGTEHFHNKLLFKAGNSGLVEGKSGRLFSSPRIEMLRIEKGVEMVTIYPSKISNSPLFFSFESIGRTSQ